MIAMAFGMAAVEVYFLDSLLGGLLWEAWIKRLLFCRQHFSINFLGWESLCFNSNFTEICVFIQISLRYVPVGPIHIKSLLVQVMGLCWIVGKPYPEPFMTQFQAIPWTVYDAVYWCIYTYICVTGLNKFGMTYLWCKQPSGIPPALIGSLLWPKHDAVQLVPICFWLMGYGQMVSMLATAVGDKRCLWDSEVMGIKPCFTAWRNSLMIGISTAASAQRHVLMYPTYKMKFIHQCQV